MRSNEHGRFVFHKPPQAEPGELERERERLIGKRIQCTALPVSDVVLQEGTVWAVFRGILPHGEPGSYRWVAKTCVLMSEKFQKS